METSNNEENVKSALKKNDSKHQEIKIIKSDENITSEKSTFSLISSIPYTSYLRKVKELKAQPGKDTLFNMS